MQQNKIKIGFGPQVTANSFYQSGVKVAQVLNQCEGFEARTFGPQFNREELADLDVIVFIKILPRCEILKELKDAGKKLILDYHDMFLIPSAHETNPLKRILKCIYYYNHEEAERKKYRFLDGCFVASQESFRIASAAGLRPYYLFRQIFNNAHENNSKVHNDQARGLTIVWTGSERNLSQNFEVEPVLADLCKTYNCRIVYLTDADNQEDEFIHYQKWSIETWEQGLLAGDIAFRWWQDSNDQRHKDANKVISYMAAGLPVVCRPTQSERKVVQHGVTGFFAEDLESFKKYVEKLICEPDLRKSMGQAAHKDVWSKYSLQQHVDEIKKYIERLLNV